MKQLFKISLSLFLFLSFLVFPAQAQEADEILGSCVQINNGGDTCYQSDSLLINKKVLKPTISLAEGRQLQDADFIENTELTEPYVRANSLTAFRLSVTNTTDNGLTNITVTDILPNQYLTYVTSEGTYNEAARTITFTIENLPAGETRAFTIQVMTPLGSLLPADPVCTTNQAKASVVNERFFILPDETLESQDNSRLCITKNETGGTPLTTQNQNGENGQRGNASTQNGTAPTNTQGGLPVVSPAPANETPNTGAESLALIGLLPAGIGGYYLRRKTT